VEAAPDGGGLYYFVPFCLTAYFFSGAEKKYKKVNMPVACLRGLAFHPKIQRPRERPSMGAGVREFELWEQHLKSLPLWGRGTAEGGG